LVTGKGIWLNDDDQVRALKYESKNEAYMATWFYTPVHELGISIQNRLSPSPIINDYRRRATGSGHGGAGQLFFLPRLCPLEAIKRAKQQRSKSVLGIGHLRSEGLADMFAASVLFKTTFDIMREINQQRFEVVRFIQEMIIFLNIIAVIERCRRVSLVALATDINKHFTVPINSLDSGIARWSSPFSPNDVGTIGRCLRRSEKTFPTPFLVFWKRNDSANWPNPSGGTAKCY
jgi:hypothetical protein